MTQEKQLELEGFGPWLPSRPAVDDEHARARNALLADLAGGRLAVLEQKVAAVLRDSPETRDSDTQLVLEYWRRFESGVLAGWHPDASLDVLHDLEKVDSITRARRRIQNQYHLYEATAWTRLQRQESQREFYQYLSYRRAGDPELRFYLDETGNDGSGFVGVGGLCVPDWAAFEPHYASLRAWRERQGWPAALHFADLKDRDVPKYVALLGELCRPRSVLIFVAHAIPAKAAKYETLFNLFVHLVKDALQHAATLGCFEVPRAIRLFKESDHGFDTLKLDRLRECLEDEVVTTFPDRAYVREVKAIEKGEDVLLECADLIASAMRRRALSRGDHAKDRLAASVMQHTGLDQESRAGALFRIHGLRKREVSPPSDPGRRSRHERTVPDDEG